VQGPYSNELGTGEFDSSQTSLNLTRFFNTGSPNVHAATDFCEQDSRDFREGFATLCRICRRSMCSDVVFRWQSLPSSTDIDVSEIEDSFSEISV
jgi:hypothetical protein